MNKTQTQMKAIWMDGDYGAFARYMEFAQYMESGAPELLENWRIPPGSRLLDVACGGGQVSLPAARAGVQVTGLDFSSSWFARARARAKAEGLAIQFDEGDAENLPYPDASFDVVVNLVGGMFAPHPERVTAELVRVCRLGGRIILASWIPPRFVGQMFKTVAEYIPQPLNIPSAVLLDHEAKVRKQFGKEIIDLKITRRSYPSYCYPFPIPKVVEFFRQHYEPIRHAFEILDPGSQVALRQDLEQVLSAHNHAMDGATRFDAEFMEVIAVRNS